MNELLKSLTAFVGQCTRLMQMIIDQEQEKMDETAERVAESKIKAPRRTPPPRR